LKRAPESASAAEAAVLEATTKDAIAEPAPSKRYSTTGTLWVSGILPLKLSRFDIRHWIVPNSRKSLRSIAETRVVPKSIFTRPFEILSVIPAPKEGGMVLKFGYDGDKEEVQRLVQEHLKKTHVKTWYNWMDIEAFPIRVTTERSEVGDGAEADSFGIVAGHTVYRGSGREASFVLVEG
jgi:hypothetical protein